MKIDKVLLFSITIFLGGVDWFFKIIAHPKTSKLYCKDEECLYLGLLFMIIGGTIILYKIFYKVIKMMNE